MAAFLIGFILTVFPVGRETCVELLPVNARSDLPVSSFAEAQQVWTAQETVPTDTLRTHIAQLQKARACFKRLPAAELDRPSPEILYTLKWEAYLQAALSQFSRTFSLYDEALAHLEKETVPPGAAAQLRARERPFLHQNRGYLHFLLGNLSDALDQYLRALEVTPDDETGERVDRLVSVGTLYQRVQDYSSAQYYFDEARRLFDMAERVDSSKLAYILHSQSDLLLEKTLNTQFERASLERARTLARRARAAANPKTERRVRATMALSESLGYLERFEEAYRLNEEVLQYARRHDDVRLRTFALLKRGVLHMQTERWTRADATLKTALDLAEELGALDYQRRILRGLGRLRESRGDWAEAESYYRRGVRVIEEYRESLTASQWSMTAFSQWRDVHRGLVRSLLAQDQNREALSALDRSRARHLQDLRTQSRVVSTQSPAVQARFDSLTQSLTEVRTRLAREGGSPDQKAALRSREAQLAAARQDLINLPPLSPRPSVDSLLRTVERQNRDVVSYFIDDPWPVYDRPAHSAAFLLSGDSLRTIPLSDVTQDSIRTLVDRTSSLFRTPDAPPDANSMHFDLQPLHTLQEAVYAPVAEHLPTDRSLTVVPDGPLFHVPFSMLVRKMPGGRYASQSARYVLHERPISLELGTSLVTDTSTSTRLSSSDPALAAFGVSEFDTLRTETPALRTLLPGASTDSTLALPSLPGVQEELDAVRHLVGNAKVALNNAATESSFRSACRRAGVLHLASHAFFHPSSPLHNAFLLRPDASSDGVLFLHELFSQSQSIPLVVLSGCSTARGTLRGGEGMAGLQYGFRTMGAQSTVSNLWPAADQASVMLMEDLYRQLQAGRPKDEALRRAKLSYLNANPRQTSPFFWAPTVLYGDPSPLDLPSRSFLSRWRSWIVGGLFIFLLAGVLAWLRRRFFFRLARSPRR